MCVRLWCVSACCACVCVHACALRPCKAICHVRLISLGLYISFRLFGLFVLGQLGLSEFCLLDCLLCLLVRLFACATNCPFNCEKPATTPKERERKRVQIQSIGLLYSVCNIQNTLYTSNELNCSRLLIIFVSLQVTESLTNTVHEYICICSIGYVHIEFNICSFHVFLRYLLAALSHTLSWFICFHNYICICSFISIYISISISNCAPAQFSPTAQAVALFVICCCCCHLLLLLLFVCFIVCPIADCHLH